MCATNDPVELGKLRRQTKPIHAWKVLQKSGLNIWTGHARAMYGPGQVKAKGVSHATQYGVFARRGLHVYRKRRDAQTFCSVRERVVLVHVDPKDLIAAERHMHQSRPQLVACRLTIRPEDWAATGLPKRATRRRYV